MRRDLAPGDDAVATIRAIDAESLVLVILPGRDDVAEAQARAVVGPLAVECAPRRVNAILVREGADAAAIDALVGFLESATSTTGQIVEIS